LEILVEQPKEKFEESQGTTRDVAIATKLHTRARLKVRDELLIVGK